MPLRCIWILPLTSWEASRALSFIISKLGKNHRVWERWNEIPIKRVNKYPIHVNYHKTVLWFSISQNQKLHQSSICHKRFSSYRKLLWTPSSLHSNIPFSFDIGTIIIISILQMRPQRLRGVDDLPQGHRANRWGCQELNPGTLSPKPIGPLTYITCQLFKSYVCRDWFSSFYRWENRLQEVQWIAWDDTAKGEMGSV